MALPCYSLILAGKFPIRGRPCGLPWRRPSGVVIVDSSGGQVKEDLSCAQRSMGTVSAQGRTGVLIPRRNSSLRCSMALVVRTIATGPDQGMSGAPPFPDGPLLQNSGSSMTFQPMAELEDGALLRHFLQTDTGKAVTWAAVIPIPCPSIRPGRCISLPREASWLMPD